MADPNRTHDGTAGAQPPGGGKQDHTVMNAAATHTVHGTSTAGPLAASGGLEVRGGEEHAVDVTSSDAATHEMIPGERDGTTLTHREPGAIGGAPFGGDIPADPVRTIIDDDTRHDHEIEGGGDAVPHRRRDHHR